MLVIWNFLKTKYYMFQDDIEIYIYNKNIKIKKRVLMKKVSIINIKSDEFLKQHQLLI